jgi:hypothetical protein
MNNRILLFFSIFTMLFSGCHNKTQKSLSNVIVEKVENHSPIMDKTLQSYIGLIQDEFTDTGEAIFFIVIFHERNDSNLIFLTYDIRPPYIVNEDNFLGFAKYENSYISFVSSLDSDSITRNFVKIDSLHRDIDAWYRKEICSWDSFDGESYLFYICSQDSIISLNRRTR